jgi:hypothetical protein
MLNHLLKRCPSMTQDDRNLAFLHMQHTSNGPAKAKKQVSDNQTGQQDAVLIQPQTSFLTLQGLRQHTLPANPVVDDTQQVPQLVHQSSREGQPTNIPPHMLMQRQRSALDTLAEVSRRHMDYSTHPNSYSDDLEHSTALRHSQDPSRAMMHHVMATARQRDNGLEVMHDYMLAALRRYNHNDSSVPRSVEPTSMPLYPAFVAQAQTGAEQPTFLSDAVQSPLAHAVTSVNRQTNEGNFGADNATIDPQLDVPIDNDEPILPEQANGPPPQPQDEFIAWTEAPQGFATQQEPPSNEPNPEFGTTQKPDKTNARARFTDTRRKEVQEVRKRGACMRCRMLKKPCSEGTPCGTCKKIDSARLWKGTCLRTKLTDEFTLYSISYFHSRMIAEISGATHGLLLVPRSGSIQVKFVPQSTFTILLGAKCHFTPTNKQAVSNNAHANMLDNVITSAKDIVVLDDTSVSQKMSSYCTNRSFLQDCIEDEKSTFLKATLQEAVALLQAEKLQEQSSHVKSTSRTNHISPSALLSNVLELWAETSILVHDREGHLQIRYNKSMSPCHDPQTVFWSDETSQGCVPLTPDFLSYRLIRSQLLAATETACHRLSRAVMNELERRLLQRQQVSAFATFISAVLLFSCIERITSFYHSMDSSPPLNTSNHVPAVLSSASGADPRLPEYPTSVPAPSTLWPQGPHFARLLTTLLRMRALPPKTTLTTDNKLAVLRELGLPVRLNGVVLRDQQDAETARAANWLDPLGLDVNFLRTRRDGDVADVGWEMKFVSAVLLSEGM